MTDKEKKIFSIIIRTAAVLYTASLLYMNYIRIFDPNLWEDEAFTANLIRLPVIDVIKGTANDVHPPLYYLLLKAFCGVFGHNAISYHAFSLIPIVIMLVFCLTIIWNKFGPDVAIIIITLCNIAECSERFNVEVRMYTLAAALVFFSFYQVYAIVYDGGKLKDYSLFFLLSIAAAYTHYYALVAVAFFYAVLFFRGLIIKGDERKYSLSVCGLAVITYIPWLKVLLESFGNRVNNYWIAEYSSYGECFNYLFSNVFNYIIWTLIIILAVFAFLYESKVINAQKNSNLEYKISFFKTIEISNWLLYVCTGFLSVVGTMAVGIIVSKLISPFFVTRYIYVVAFVAWFVLGMIIHKLFYNYGWALLLVLFMLVNMIPLFKETAYWERDFAERTQQLINTVAVVDDSDLIITNFSDSTMPTYYFNGKNFVDVHNPEDVVITPMKNQAIWFFLDDSWAIDSIANQLSSKGLNYELVLEGGMMGKAVVNVYRCY